MFKLDLEKAEESEIKFPASVGSQKKQEDSRKTSTSASSMNHNKLWKILKEKGIPDPFTCILETCMQVKKQQLEPDM